MLLWGFIWGMSGLPFSVSALLSVALSLQKHSLAAAPDSAGAHAAAVCLARLSQASGARQG